MKKRLTMCLLGCLLSCITAWAYNFEVNGVYYNITDVNAKTVEVTFVEQGEGNSDFYYGSVTIPNRVSKNNVIYDVVRIGDYAFEYCANLTSINIPNSVTSIGRLAFYVCSGLTSITIPNSVTGIGDCAFFGCSGLTSVTIPNSVTSIEEYAFYGCSGLTSVTIPNSVTSIEKYAFGECTSLTSVTIPNSVTGIADGTFVNCSGLTSVTIPNSVTSIGGSAFNWCTSLTSITIPNSVASIGNCTFWHCTGFTSITIPNSVTSIGTGAFGECFDLTSVTIPNSVTSIGDGAFQYCSNLLSITIPNSVTNIGLGITKGCYKIASIVVSEGNNVYDSRDNCNAIINSNTNELIAGCKNTIIPNDVTSIGTSAFSGCYIGETSFTIPNSVTSIGDEAFWNCNALRYLTIPNSVTSIGHDAFAYCYGLNSVTLNSATSLGDNAFFYCSYLTSVTSESTTPVAITENVFSHRANATLYVPVGSKAAYQAADYWKDFKEIVEIIMFADANVKALCVANWDTDGDGELSVAEAAAVTNLGEVFRGNTDIASFDELQYFNGLTMIADNAFRDCSGLTSITIPSSVTSIGEWSFAGCSSLNAIVIPVNVTSIYGNSFGGCADMEQMSVAQGNTVYDSRNGCNAIIETATNKLVAGCQTTQIPVGITAIGNHAFGGKWGMQQMAIPETVTTIETEAFTYCTSLSSITLPASISVIGNGAFIGCENLVRVRCDMEIPPTIAWDVFTNRANATLIVPSGSKAAYEAADYWKEFREIVGMTNIITNSDLEGDDVSCFYARENYVENQDILHATIVNGVGKDGSRGFVVQSVDNPEEAWTSQFFVRLTQPLPVGTKYRFSFDYKASQDADAHMECHHEPSEYIYGWFGGTSFTTSWQHYESEGTITEEQSPYDNQMRTIAFNLSEINTATTYYFDNIVFEIIEEEVDNNRLYITETAVQQGSGNIIPVLLENENAYGSLEFDVTLPTGITLSQATKSDRLSDAFTLQTSSLGGNIYKVLLYNINHQSISGNDGVLLNLVVNVGSVAKGDYEIVLSNIVASDVDASSSVYLADSYSILHVGDAMKGDVTGDGRVNVTDIMAVANYILKIPMTTFNEQAADVNGDERINVTDIMGIANIILKVGNNSQAAPRRREQLLDPQ